MKELLEQQKITNGRLLQLQNKTIEVRNACQAMFNSLSVIVNNTLPIKDLSEKIIDYISSESNLNSGLEWGFFLIEDSIEASSEKLSKIIIRTNKSIVQTLVNTNLLLKKINPSVSTIGIDPATFTAITSELTSITNSLVKTNAKLDATITAIKGIPTPTPEETPEEKRERIETQTDILKVLKSIDRRLSDSEPETPVDNSNTMFGWVGTIVAGALGGMIGAFQYYTNNVRLLAKGILSVYNGLKKAFSWFTEKTGLDTKIQAIKLYVNSVINMLKNTVKAVFDTFVKEPIVDFIEYSMRTIKAFIRTQMTRLMTPLAPTIDLVRQMIENTKRFVRAVVFALSVSYSGSKIETLVNKISTKIKNVVDTIKRLDLATVIFNILVFMHKVKEFFRPVTNALSEISAAFSDIKKFSRPVTQIVDSIKGAFSKVMGFFRGIGGFFEQIGSFSKLVRGFSTIVKKLPIIGWLFTAFDTITGIMEGYKVDGIRGALIGGLTAFWDSFVGGFLDLLKDLASWALRKLGFTEIADTLDEISLTFKKGGLMEKLQTGVTDLMESIMYPFDHFKELFAKFKEWVSGFSLSTLLETFGLSNEKVEKVKEVENAVKNVAKEATLVAESVAETKAKAEAELTDQLEQHPQVVAYSSAFLNLAKLGVTDVIEAFMTQKADAEKAKDMSEAERTKGNTQINQTNISAPTTNSVNAPAVSVAPQATARNSRGFDAGLSPSH